MSNICVSCFSSAVLHNVDVNTSSPLQHACPFGCPFSPACLQLPADEELPVSYAVVQQPVHGLQRDQLVGHAPRHHEQQRREEHEQRRLHLPTEAPCRVASSIAADIPDPKARPSTNSTTPQKSTAEIHR